MATISKKTQTEIHSPNNLDLPPELDIQPKFVVKVGKNWTARVYETTRVVKETNDVGNKTKEIPVYITDVRHNTSGKNQDSYHRNMEHVDLLSVMLSLRNVAAELAPKERRTREDNDIE